MIRKDKRDIYESTLLRQLGVRHGFSNRRYGDLRIRANRNAFLNDLDLDPDNLILGEQIHGTRILNAGVTDKGKVVPGIDGLITTAGCAPVVLGVTFADCVPILAVDPYARIIGSAHAGWKGTLTRISRTLISDMVSQGASTEHIYASIGPHIGMCCYNVNDDRATEFQRQFTSSEKIAARIQGEWHVDIGYANFQILTEAGLKPIHIDAPATCTSCQIGEFNSYRKDKGAAFGLQLAVIAQ